MTLQDDLLTLGITAERIATTVLTPCPEATDLVAAGHDLFGRPQRMTPQTSRAWSAMQSAARLTSIDLQLVSAFRSIKHQCEVIRRKLDEGRSLDDILRNNAIPGYSEHHTGRALDLHSGEGSVLTESFDQTPAYNWLTENADRFGFYLSYPKNNPLSISYEPWHWCHKQ